MLVIDPNKNNVILIIITMSTIIKKKNKKKYYVPNITLFLNINQEFTSNNYSEWFWKFMQLYTSMPWFVSQNYDTLFLILIEIQYKIHYLFVVFFI